MVLLQISAAAVWGQQLEKIYTSNGEIYKGYICEQVPGEYICVKTEASTYRLAWDAVQKTEKLDRNQDFSRGLSDVVVLKTGRYYRGHIVETVVGDHYRMSLPDSSDVVIRYGNVFSISTEPSRAELPLWSQVELLDRIDVRSGDIIEGLIVTRLIGQSLTIKAKDNSVERVIPLADIIKYVKVPNPAYEAPAPAVEPEPVEVTPPTFAEKVSALKLNGKALSAAKLSSEADGTLVLKDKNVLGVKTGVTTLSLPVDSSAVQKIEVLRLNEKQIYFKDKSLYPYYKPEDELTRCSFTVAVVRKDSVELLLDSLEPGFYLVLPYLENGEAAVFEVVK